MRTEHQAADEEQTGGAGNNQTNVNEGVWLIEEETNESILIQAKRSN